MKIIQYAVIDLDASPALPASKLVQAEDIKVEVMIRVLVRGVPLEVDSTFAAAEIIQSYLRYMHAEASK